MITMDIDQQVPTPQDVAPALNRNGWSLEQVAGLWTVSSGERLQGEWNDAAIVSLGGRRMVTRVWNDLKDAVICP